MTSPILFAGGEDIDFQPIGTGFSASLANNVWTADTTAGRFRVGYARQALTLQGTNGTTQGIYWLRTPAFAASTFWVSLRAWVGTGSGGLNAHSARMLRLLDANGVMRLALRGNGSTQPTSPFIAEKVNAAGTATTLVTSSAGLASLNPVTPDKIDIAVNYAAAGSLQVYVNGVLVASYSGDVTTDGVTALAYLDLGSIGYNTGNSGTVFCAWSEVIVSTRDTRNMSLLTQAPLANGNSTTFTSGVASNVNETLNSDATVDYAAAAGQLQEYTVSPAVPAGNFSVLDLIHHGRVTAGSSGPTHFQFAVRTGGTDYVSGTIAPTGAFATYAANWETNPNTGAAWTTAQIVNASALFNMGVKSLA